MSPPESLDSPRPVAEDLSAYVISGRVIARPRAARYDTDARSVSQGIQDGVDAERLGFRRVFLSERWNLKEAGVVLGAIAARTSRIDVASGIITTPARHPLHAAGLGATMQAAFGPRFVLGLGRGNPGWLDGAGMKMPTYRALLDYVDILRRLWAGEEVSYDGPPARSPTSRWRTSTRRSPPLPCGSAPSARASAPRRVLPGSTVCCYRQCSPRPPPERSSTACTRSAARWAATRKRCVSASP